MSERTALNLTLALNLNSSTYKTLVGGGLKQEFNLFNEITIKKY